MFVLLVALLVQTPLENPPSGCVIHQGRAPIPVRAAPAVFVRSANFLVEAPETAMAERVLAWCEATRSELLRRWDSAPADQPDAVPPWPRPVHVVVHRHHPGFYATTFGSDGSVTITLWAGDLHLESTVRHEVCHAVLHLRYPGRYIPRWLDEGLAVCQELPDEQHRLLEPLRSASRRFSVRQLMLMREYPREVLLFYAQSYSLTDFLVKRHGESALLRFLEASFTLGQEAALKQVLGYADCEALEAAWWSAFRSKNP